MGLEASAGDPNLPFKEWISQNLSLRSRSGDDAWKERFSICLWWIWKWRNEQVFNYESISMERKVVAIHAYNNEIAITFCSILDSRSLRIVKVLTL